MNTRNFEIDDKKFQAVARQWGNGQLPQVTAANSKDIPWWAKVLVGRTEQKFGGLMTNTGFVMDGEKPTHWITVDVNHIASNSIPLP